MGRLDFDFEHLNVVSLLDIYLPGKIMGQTPIEGTIQIRGPLRMPRELMASGEFRSFSVEVEGVQVAAVEPIRFEVADQTVLLERFHLAGSGTDFAAHGRAHLPAPRRWTCIERLRQYGAVAVAQSEYSGAWYVRRECRRQRQPCSANLQGRLDVKNTFISHNDFPTGLSDLNGVMLFDRNRIQIEKLTGTTGGGTSS